jgi:death on curing protein
VTHPIHYLDVADFLLIAEAVLGVAARELAYSARIDLAESALAAPTASFEGTELRVTFGEKAAVLCRHLIRNHPLPDGNKRVGYLCLVEFAERNGYYWTSPLADDPDGDETVSVIEAVGAGVMDEHGLARWIEQRLLPRE